MEDLVISSDDYEIVLWGREPWAGLRGLKAARVSSSCGQLCRVGFTRTYCGRPREGFHELMQRGRRCFWSPWPELRVDRLLPSLLTTPTKLL